MFRLLIIVIGFFIINGCTITSNVPKRNVDFDHVSDVVKSYYDYKGMEEAGIETVEIKNKFYNRTVSLPYYLYIIAKAFERFDRENDATKLYLRLLINYPLIHEGEQLGVNAENRLRWLIGDKQWVVSSVDELILRIEYAIRSKDASALKKLISRDFGFGRTKSERFAIQYQDGLQLIVSDFGTMDHPAVEIIEKQEDEKIVLKTTGWQHGKKIWYFALHRNKRMHGWEWDLAFWEQNE